FFSAGVPATGVYFVSPRLMAAIAASLMWSGVSKSGSPAPRPIMSLPAALSSAALAVTASVGDGLTSGRRGAVSDMDIPGNSWKDAFLGQDRDIDKYCLGKRKMHICPGRLAGKCFLERRWYNQRAHGTRRHADNTLIQAEKHFRLAGKEGYGIVVFI